MKTPWLLLSLVLLSSCSASASKATDLSTDDGVRSAWAEATDGKAHEDDCVGRTGVRDVIVVGSFAHNRGCDLEGAFVGGEYVPLKDLMSTTLGTSGWGAMDAKARSDFALEWTSRVLYRWGGSVVTQAEKAFSFDDTPAFAAPTAVVEGDVVVVLLWVEEPPGMQDIDVFEQVELRFDARGAVSRSQKGAFSVDGARVRG